VFKTQWILLAVAALALGLAARRTEAGAPKLEIQRATYEATDGAGKADVTDKVKAMLKGGRLVVEVSNDALGGDPANGHVKQLKLEYTLDGKALVLTAREGETIAIPELPPPSPEEALANALAVLKSDAPQADKAGACRLLQRVGTKAAIPALVALLPDAKLSHMALYALEPMPFPEVDDALRAALPSLKGRQLAGVINSLGVRRDPKAVGPIAKFLGDPDRDVAAIAVRAVGTIGTPEAAKVLTAAMATPSVPVADGALRCADALAAAGYKAEALALYELVRTSKAAPFQRAAGVRGIVRTKGAEGAAFLAEQLRSGDYLLFAALIHLVQQELPEKEITQALMAEAQKAAGDKKLLLIQALGWRRDEAALPTLAALASAGDPPMRVAAILALATIGKPAVVPALAKLCEDADTEIAKAAQEALASVPGQEADQAILALLEAKEAPRRVLGIQLANRRRIAGVMPAILKAAKDPDATVRTAAFGALRDLATEADVPALLDLLAAAEAGAEADAALQALLAACRDAAQPDALVARIAEKMAASPAKTKAALLRALGAVGGPAALKAVRTAAADADTDVKRAALRALAEWKDAEAGATLAELARTAANDTDKLLCLRGLLGLAGRQNLPPDQRLALCKQAAALITRDDERKQLLGALGGIQTPEALAEIVPHLDNAATKAEASLAILGIAEKLLQGRQTQANAAKVAGPLEKVVEAAATPELVNRAKALLKRAPAPRVRQ